VRKLLAAWAFALAACGGGDGGAPASPPSTPPAGTADINLLFMGNSHISTHGLPEMVAGLVRGVRPGRTVRSVVAPGWMFLDERATDAPSVELLRGGGWSHVVLQAQKYSSSGMFEYSTDGAVALIRTARAVNAVPVLFPEWPRRGVAETATIYDLHASIAQREPACVAPVGQAWDLALARQPSLVLHAADGNHSAPAGAFLAAVIIAATIANVSPDAFAPLDGIDVDPQLQAQLRAIAAETVLVYRPRRHCPNDP